jgi:hypothetical protein
MSVSVISVDSELDHASFPNPNGNLINTDVANVDVKWADDGDRASSQVVKAVFFAYANLHEILAESGFNIKQR